MILVTGSTDLLGSHLLFDLTKQGLSVRAIKRTTSDVKMVHKIFSYYTDQTDALFERIQWVDADLLDFGALVDAMEGISEMLVRFLSLGKTRTMVSLMNKQCGNHPQKTLFIPSANTKLNVKFGVVWKKV